MVTEDKSARFITLQEAADMWGTDYTVKRLLPHRGVVLLYGEPACGKSFSMLSAAVHISEGWPLGNHRVKKKPIYYLALEGSGGLGKRVRAFKAWAEAAGKPQLQGTFYFWTHGFALHAWDECRSLCDSILAAGHSGAVVVVDTLSQSTLGLDENSSDMALAIGNATQIAEAIGGLVVLVHHVGKDSARGPRGHSSLMGNVDCAIQAVRSGDGCKWTVKKSKDDAEGHGIDFKLPIFEVGVDPDGEIMTSCVAEPCRAEKQRSTSTIAEVLKPGSAAEKCFATFLLALHEVKTDGVHIHIDDWRKIFYARSTADSQNTKRNSFSRARNELVNMGVLTVENDVYALTAEFRRKLQAEHAERHG